MITVRFFLLFCLMMGSALSSELAFGTVAGYIDAVKSTAASGEVRINGWSCIQGSPSSVSVQVYAGASPSAGGVKIAVGTANLVSEFAVATACKTVGSNFRYNIPLSPALIAQYSGKPIYVTGAQTTTLLVNSGKFSLPVVAGQSTSSPKTVAGYVDAVKVAANGGAQVTGWSCIQGSPTSISVQVYAGGSPSSGGIKIAVGMANQSSEAAVATACKTVGSNFRYDVLLPAALVTQYSGKAIYVTGAEATTLLVNSGRFSLPVVVRQPAGTPTTVSVGASSIRNSLGQTLNFTNIRSVAFSSVSLLSQTSNAVTLKLNTTGGRFAQVTVNRDASTGRFISVVPKTGVKPYLCYDSAKNYCEKIAISSAATDLNCSSPIFFRGTLTGSVSNLAIPADMQYCGSTYTVADQASWLKPLGTSVQPPPVTTPAPVTDSSPSIVSRCQLIAQDCPLQGNPSRPFVYDVADSVSTTLNRCLLRSDELKSHCGTRRQVMARAYNSVGEEVGRRILPGNAGTENLPFQQCQLTAQDCPSQGNPDRPFTYSDTADGAGTNLNRCLTRADDLKLYCKTNNPVSAVAVNAGGAVIATYTIPADAPSRMQSHSPAMNIDRWLLRWQSSYNGPSAMLSPALAMADARNFVSDAELADLKARGFKSIRVPFDIQYLFRPVFPGSASSVAYNPQNPYLPVLWTVANRVMAAGMNVTLVPVLTDPCFQALLEKDTGSIVSHCTDGPGRVISDYDRNAKAFVMSDPNTRSRLMSQYIEFWRGFANYLHHTMDPSRFLIEPFNEPIYLSNPGQWNTDQSALLQAIRGSAPRHTMVATSTSWSKPELLMALNVSADKNVVYNFHFYLNVFTHQGFPWIETFKDLPSLPYPTNWISSSAWEALLSSTANPTARAWAQQYRSENWNKEKINGIVGAAAQWAQRNGVVLMANEFGTYKNINQIYRENWARDVRTAMQNHGVGWAVWDYKGEFATYNVTSPVPVAAPSMLNALGL